jgi:O-antigen/teichoic acid export membrane protein
MSNNETKGSDVISGTTIAKGVAILGGGNIALRLLGVAVAVLMLRWLSLFEFGVYRLVLAAYDLAAGLFLAGVENVVVSDVSEGFTKNERRAKTLFSVYFFFMMSVSVVLWALFFFVPEFLALWFGTAGEYLKIISFLFLLAPLETAYKLAFQIFLDFWWGTLFRILREAGRIRPSPYILFLFFVWG